MDQNLFAVAVGFQETGAFAQARQLYRRLLAEQPDGAELWRRLGEACQALGDRAAAEAAHRRALELEPHAGAYNNLGIVLMEQGRFDEAASCYHRALQLLPGYAEAYNNLGIARMDAGRLDEAVANCREALRLRPDYPAAHNNLGMALARQGLLPEAEASYRRAAQLQPDFTKAYGNLGHLLRGAGRREEAAAAYRQALATAPGDPALHDDLGVTLLGLGKVAEAEECHRQALRCQPDFASAYNNLGVALLEQDRWDDAMLSFRQALFLKPDLVEAHYNLGRGCLERGMADEALASFEEAVRLKPDAVGALNNLGNAYKDQGRLDEAVACYRQALAAAPHDAALHSNLLFCLLYHPRLAPDEVFREHLEFGRRHTPPPPAPAQPLPVEPLAGRRLRVGYVSADFRQHVVGWFIERVLAALDREHFEAFCYSDVRKADAATERIRGGVEHWRSLVGWSDDRAADLVRQDRIDVLIDLAGHTGGNRLPMFALRPAPVQATHYGYPATTGLAAMDYRITDADVDPPGFTERWHTEELVRLPGAFWVYHGGPPLEVGPPPAARAGRFTFGSFNNLAKVTEEVLALWARVLRSAPDARMRLSAGKGTAGERRVLGAFARAGVDVRRIALVERRPFEDYFRLHNDVDACLDPFPFTGCNTTADALWMGVPVVTLAGKTCVSRQGAGLLRAVGLEDLVAETPDGYVDVAARLAADAGRLAALRAGLRARMIASPLMDEGQFTRRLEAAYIAMWQKRRR